MWPLCFWLPGAYSAASAPAAALFAVLSKVGVYAILRIGTLFLGADVAASPSPGTPWLVVAGMGTLVYGALGVLASQDLPRLASYSVLVSSGTLLAAIAIGNAALTGAALYYLVVSTLALSAFFLLVELVERGRGPGADVLAVTAEAFGADAGRRRRRATSARRSRRRPRCSVSRFAACAIMLAGLPPLAGFIGKFAMLRRAARARSGAGDVVDDARAAHRLGLRDDHRAWRARACDASGLRRTRARRACASSSSRRSSLLLVAVRRRSPCGRARRCAISTTRRRRCMRRRATSTTC